MISSSRAPDSQGKPVRVDMQLRLPVNPRDQLIAAATAPPSAGTAEATQPAIDSTVPVSVINNVTLVQALLNGKEQVRLMLDTGASYTLLTPEVAKRLKIRPRADAPRRKLKLVGTATLDVSFVHLAALQVGDALVEDLEVGITPVAPGNPFLDGLLGGDFLSHFTTQLDHAKSRLRLMSQPSNAPR